MCMFNYIHIYIHMFCVCVCARACVYISNKWKIQGISKTPVIHKLRTLIRLYQILELFLEMDKLNATIVRLGMEKPISS